MITIRQTLFLITAIIVTLACGCSTVFMQHEKTGQYSLFVDPGVLCSHDRAAENNIVPKYYSGVTFDLYTIFVASFADNEANEYNSLVRYLYPAALIYAVVDLPFSLLADTVTFPYDYYVRSCSITENGKTYSRWSEGSEHRFCSTPGIHKIRDEFQRFYDQKAYVQARAKLEPIIKTCSNMINSTDLGWIRNDLAITMYNLGDYDGCLDVLKPLKENAEETDENLRTKFVSQYGPQFGPTMADTPIQIAKTTRANLRLCNRSPENANQNAREGH